MEVHDLAVSKLCAGRQKDLEFVDGLVQSGLVDRTILLQRLTKVIAPSEVLTLAEQRVRTS